MDGIGVLVMDKSIVQSRRQFAAWCALPVAVFCALLAGCDVGPRYVPPATTAPQVYKETPAQFEEAGEWSVAKPQDAALRGKWWEIYNDPDLNALEDQLNIDNQNIRQAFDNFMEARALVREARSQYFPTVSVGVPTLDRKPLPMSDLRQAAARQAAARQAVNSRRFCYSGRCIVGARPVGEGPQHGACSQYQAH